MSALFYNGHVRTGRHLPSLLDYPVVEFIDSSVSEPQESNRVNFHEVNICQALIDQLVANHPSRAPSITVGVLSPFRAQAAYLRQILCPNSSSVALDSDTVHVAQGRTYDVVIMSLAATTLSPFLNPLDKWCQYLHHSLPKLFPRLKREAAALHQLDYPDFTPCLDLIHHHWAEQLASFSAEGSRSDQSSLRLRLFEDVDLDLVFDLDVLPRLPENDFAPNILNVALSLARHRLVILGHYDVLHQNPLVNLPYSWAKVFDRINVEPFSQMKSRMETNGPCAFIHDRQQWNR